MLNDELTMAQNMTFFTRVGSSNGRLLNQMVTAFGLADRKNVLAKNLTVSERHIVQLLAALSGSNRTLILDDPFQGLSQ